MEFNEKSLSRTDMQLGRITGVTIVPRRFDEQLDPNELISRKTVDDFIAGVCSRKIRIFDHHRERSEKISKASKGIHHVNTKKKSSKGKAPIFCVGQWKPVTHGAPLGENGEKDYSRQPYLYVLGCKCQECKDDRNLYTKYREWASGERKPKWLTRRSKHFRESKSRVGMGFGGAWLLFLELMKGTGQLQFIESGATLEMVKTEIEKRREQREHTDTTAAM